MKKSKPARLAASSYCPRNRGKPNIQRLSTKDILVEAYAAAQPWKALLADAERRVRRMPKTSRGREQLLDGITDARRVAEMVGIRPPQVGRG